MSIKKNKNAEPPAPEKINLDDYVPFFITTIANRWTASASKKYLSEFQIGVAEWRVLAALSVFGQATSLEIVNLISMDAGAVSRAMRSLAKNGFVTPVEGRFKGRNKPFMMTGAGASLFRRVRSTALSREKFILQDLDGEERRLLLAALRKIHARIADL